MSSPNTFVIPVLTGSIAVIGANSLALGPIAPVIGADIGADITTTMLAAGGYGIGTTVGALFLSRIIDSFGAKAALCWALFALAAAFVGSAMSPTIEFLIGSQFAAGLAAGVGLPAIYAFTALVAPKGQESTLLGRVLVGWTISMVAGVSLSSVVADFYHWRGVYAGLAGLTVLAFIFVSRTHYEQNRQRSSETMSALSALGLKGVPSLLLICLAYMTAFYGTYGYIGDHIHTRLDLPVTAGGAIALIYGLGFGAAALGDPYIDRYGSRRILPWCFLSIALIYALLGLGSGSYFLLMAASFLWGFVNHFGLNLIVAGLCAIDARHRGAILGLNSAVTYLAASLGVLSVGPLYEAGGFSMLAFAACIAVSAAVLAAALFAGGNRCLRDRAFPVWTESSEQIRNA